MFQQVIAQIKEVTADSKTDPMITPKPNKGRKAKVNLHDLPRGAGPKFGALFIPLIRAYAGIVPAWTDPQIPTYRKHWKNVYGGDLICGWEKDDPVRVLVCDSIPAILRTNR